MKIGFIGLGIMGAPMAANLVKAGFEVTGYNRSPARVEQLIAAGGQGAKDIAGAVADADVVATMLPDSPDVRAVLSVDASVASRRSHGGTAPDQVLVSRTVVDLVVGSGLDFADHGEHQLKGVPGTWHLFSVVD